MLQSGFAEERDIQYLFSEECSNPDNLIAMEGKGFFFLIFICYFNDAGIG